MGIIPPTLCPKRADYNLINRLLIMTPLRWTQINLRASVRPRLHLEVALLL